METFVIVLLVILTLVFLVSAAGITLILQNQFCRCEEYEMNRGLVNAEDDDIEDMELNDLGLQPMVIQKVLNDPHWTQEASGAIPVCLEMLHIVHGILEHAVTSVMRSVQSGGKLQSSTSISAAASASTTGSSSHGDLVRFALSVSRRVDDLVESMYPPIDLQIIEGRCCSLVSSVKYLIRLIRSRLPPRREESEVGKMDLPLQKMELLHKEIRLMLQTGVNYSSTLLQQSSLFSVDERSRHLDHVCNL